MKLSFITKSLQDIGFLTIAFTLALTANFAYGQWVNPDSPATTNNVAAPIHASSSAQTKTGIFEVADILAVGTSEAGTHMRSPFYCDGNGNNCFSANSGGSSEGLGKAAYGLAGPPGVSNWPDWIFCGKPFFFDGARTYKDSQTSGAWSIGFDANGYRSASGDCGTIQDVCADGRCGFYDGSAPTVQSGLVCNAYGCSEYGACSTSGCPSSSGETCNEFGCSEYGACAAGGCPSSADEVCDAYGCSSTTTATPVTPATPSNLGFVCETNGTQVTVSWDPVNPNGGYNVRVAGTDYHTDNNWYTANLNGIAFNTWSVQTKNATPGEPWSNMSSVQTYSCSGGTIGG